MIKTTLKWLFFVVATFYATDGAFKLMSMPNDFAFWAGFVMLFLTGLFWVDVIRRNIAKAVEAEQKSEEKNEKS